MSPLKKSIVEILSAYNKRRKRKILITLLLSKTFQDRVLVPEGRTRQKIFDVLLAHLAYLFGVLQKPLGDLRSVFSAQKMRQNHVIHPGFVQRQGVRDTVRHSEKNGARSVPFCRLRDQEIGLQIRNS